MSNGGAVSPAFNMADRVIGRAARESPGKTALVVVHDLELPFETWSYERLWQAVLAAGGALREAGLQPGDRFLIQLDNTSLYPILYFGGIAAGYVPVPVSQQLTAREIAFLAADSGARLAMVEDGTEDIPVAGITVVARSDFERSTKRSPMESTQGILAETRADDAAFLVYTSGTSGTPKGVLHAHRSVLGRRPMYEGWYGIRSDDCVLHAGAFNWTYTLGAGLADPWCNGATAIVYTGEKTPDVWPRLIKATGATLFAAVPGVIRQILKYAPPTREQVGSLRHGLIAGEAPPPGLFEDWHAATGTELHEALGMSEISTFISTSPTVPRKAGTVGKPQDGRRVAVLPVEGGADPLPPGEEGLLAVHRSDPGLMLGYWRRPAETAEAMRGDWFVTSDVVRMDDDGYVIHLGRNDDVMNAGGYRVAPQEIEAVLAVHPDVSEVACAEFAIRPGVSIIAAFVVPCEGALFDAGALRAFAAADLAAYKCPREIFAVDALPRTANGKIRRRELGKSLPELNPSAA